MAQRAEEIGVDVLDRLHEDLGVPAEDIVAGLHLADRDIAQWRRAGQVPCAAAVDRLQVLVKLRDGLYTLFADASGVHDWMRAELRYLHWHTPQQVVRAGEPERVYAAFEALASGIVL